MARHRHESGYLHGARESYTVVTAAGARRRPRHRGLPGSLSREESTMSATRSRTLAALVGGITISALCAGGTAWARGATAPSSVVAKSVVTLPQKPAAHKAAVWLASKVNAKGFVTFSGTPDVSDTTLVVLALAAAGSEHATALRSLSYLKAHVNAYVTSGGHDGAGQLATLILDAHEMRQSPTSFGGTNLVKRLLKTMRS